ncbi:MAG: ion transporter [Pseudomonadota bacterium]|nr:ion transporter [Pseudomonadota bacterium]
MQSSDRPQRLNGIVNQPDTRAGKVFDLTVQGLVIVSLISFSVATLPDLSNNTLELLRWIEVTVVVLFTAEYLLRLEAAGQPLAYALSFFGVVDLLAILPFYLTTGIELRAVKVQRALRIISPIKLTRYNAAMSRFARSFALAKEEFALFVIATMMILFLAAVGIYYFERDAQPEAFASVFHSLWWAVTTLTTVGYGDVYPITVGGRFFTYIVVMVGLGVIAVPASVLASALTRAREEEVRTRSERSE